MTLFHVFLWGVLLDGTELVVKLLTQKSHQGTDDFLNEVVSIANIRHKNLVTLKGCYLHGTQCLLVYEFVENNNLVLTLWGTWPTFTLVLYNMEKWWNNVKSFPKYHDHHHNQWKIIYFVFANLKIDNTLFLNWPTRFKICVGITRGLVYLHEDLQPCIIHPDIKTSNILLNKNFNAKIVNFGLAWLYSIDQSQLFTQVVGTF